MGRELSNVSRLDVLCARVAVRADIPWNNPQFIPDWFQEGGMLRGHALPSALRAFIQQQCFEGKLLQSIDVGEGTGVYALQSIGDSRVVCGAGNNGAVVCVETGGGQKPKVVDTFGKGQTVWGLFVADDLIFAGRGNGKVDAYDVQTFMHVRAFPGRNTAVWCLAAWKGALYSGGTSENIHCWDIQSGNMNEKRCFAARQSTWAMEVKDGHLFCGTSGGTEMWDLNRGEPKFMRIFEFPENEIIRSIAFHGNSIIQGGRRSVVMQFDISSGELLGSFPRTGEKGVENEVKAVTVWGDFLFAAGQGGEIFQYDLATQGNLVRSWDAHPGQCVSCILALPNGVLVSGSQDKTIKVWK